MDIRIVRESISLAELEDLAQTYHRRLVKGVADIERGIIALGGEWHIDANNVLIARFRAKECVGFQCVSTRKGRFSDQIQLYD